MKRYITITKESSTELTKDGQLRCFSFRFRQPLLEFLKCDDAAVAFLFLFSGFLAPGIEAFIGNSSGLDPSKPSLVFLAVSLEYRIIRLLLCPLLECTNLTADLLTFGDGTFTVLSANTHHLWEPASAVLAATNGDVSFHARPERVVDHVKNAGGVENRRTPAFFRWLKADRDGTELEQLGIFGFVVIVVARCLRLRIPSCLIHIQDQFEEPLYLILILRQLCCYIPLLR